MEIPQRSQPWTNRKTLKHGGQPFVLLLDSSTLRSPGGGKEIDLRSNHTKKQIENEKKKISFPPPGDSQSAQTCFFGVVETMSKFETKNGHEWGAIWSNRDETRPRLQEIWRRIFLYGPWGLGAAVLGTSWNMCHFQRCFWDWLDFFQRNKSDELGQTRPDWDTIDTERIPTSGFRLLGGFWRIVWRKKGGKNKFDFPKFPNRRLGFCPCSQTNIIERHHGKNGI